MPDEIEDDEEVIPETDEDEDDDDLPVSVGEEE